MKKIIILLIVSLSVSCTLQYDGETRLIVEGNLKDRAGNPLAGKSTFVRLSNGSDDDIISNTVSDNNGHFLMIFPAPDSQNDDIGIFLGGDSTYQSKYLTKLHTNDFTNYRYTVDEIFYKSEDITQLNVIPNRTNSTMHLTSISIVGLQTFVERNFDEIYSDDQPKSFYVIKDQNLTLHYTIYNESTEVSTDYTENITINNSNVDYQITY